MNQYLKKHWYLILVMLIATGVVVSTYRVFSATWDEPEHLAAGMALVDQGQYPYDTQHPPLARMMMALGPYVAGAHAYGRPGPSGEQEGRDILYLDNQYELYLSLARAGMLPFLWILFIATWLWANRYYGSAVANLSITLLLLSSPLIGHAALATLDMPLIAMMMLTLYLYLRWCETSQMKYTVMLGIAAGLAIATKLSAIPFLGITILAWMAASVLLRKNIRAEFSYVMVIKKYFLQGTAAVIVALLTCIATYSINSQLWSDHFAVTTPTGLVRFIDSIRELLKHNTSGHLSYLFGNVSEYGWWNFYVVAILVKTPLPMLVLGACGIIWSLWQGRKNNQWIVATPAIALCVIVIFSSLYSNINIGIRHILIIFPILAMLAAYVAVSIWRKMNKIYVNSILVVALGWMVLAFIKIHPDYLAYFNEFAGSEPENIIIDSDLDWGQDIKRLGNELKSHQVDKLWVLYRGTADLTEEKFPEWHHLKPGIQVDGWVAVSIFARRVNTKRDAYNWLEQYKPIQRVGKSFDLYFIPPQKTVEQMPHSRN